MAKKEKEKLDKKQLIEEQSEAMNTKAEGSGQNLINSKNFKSGAYSTLMILMMIVVVLVINLAVTTLDLQVDVSKSQVFTLTDTTKEILSGLENDISIYYIAQEGLQEETIYKIVERYPAESSKVHLELKDVVLYPNFAKQYTTGEILNNSLIVVNNDTGAYKYIDYENLLAYANTSSSIEASGLDVEGQVTAGIVAVSSSDLPTMYYVGGHGETKLSDAFTKSVGKQNITLKNLNMYTATEIPEDCDVLLFNGPTYDLSEEESQMVKDFMAKGGNVVILLSNSEEELPNLEELLRYYGVERHPGIIVESSGYYLGTYRTYLLPQVGYHMSITRTFSDGLTMILPMTQGLTEVSDQRASLSVHRLLKTSNEAYLKADTQATTTQKEAGDEDGPFDLGYYIEENDGKKGKMLVLASHYFINQTMLESGQYGNEAFMAEVLAYMTGVQMSIPARSLQQQYVVPTHTQSIVWAVITVGVIPLILLTTGFIIWIRRRRR
ncbi:MAG: Gldg family protein [Lachnospiraceae bacterium]|nr:Gldg family protein [Lachnospiraceae bacterium]